MAGQRKTVTITSETPEILELPLDQWLMQHNDSQGTPDAVVRIDVQRKHPTGKWGTLGRPYSLEPPFDVDLTPLFERFGDGEYRFLPIKGGRGGLLGARVETIEGFGVGSNRTGAGSPFTARPTATQSVDFSQALEQMQVEYQMARLEDLRESLEERREAREERRRARQTAESLSPAEQKALASQAADADLERLIKLKALIPEPRPSEFGEMLTAMLPKVLDKVMTPAEPTERLLGTVEKVLEIKDRLAGDGGGLAGMLEGAPTWALLAAILAGNPQVQGVLAAFATRMAGLKPGQVPELPPAPGPEANAPTSPHPAAPSPTAPPSGMDGAPPQHQTTMTGNDPRSRFLNQIWPIVVNAAQRNAEDASVYCAMLDDQMPGFLQQWVGMGKEKALEYLMQLGVAPDHPTRPWFERFYQEAAIYLSSGTEGGGNG